MYFVPKKARSTVTFFIFYPVNSLVFSGIVREGLPFEAVGM